MIKHDKTVSILQESAQSRNGKTVNYRKPLFIKKHLKNYQNIQLKIKVPKIMCYKRFTQYIQFIISQNVL